MPLENESGFYKTLVKVAIPIALQNLIQSTVGFADAAMVSQLGAESLAAVGLGNQVFFAVCVVIFGIASGGAFFISRYWGAKNLKALRSVTGLTLLAALVLAVPIGLVCYFQADSILYFFAKNHTVQQLGSPYLKLTAFSFPLTAITITLSIQLRCVEKSQYPMLMSLASLIIDIVLNYCLIYGQFGFPALGVTGAAIATLIARAAETLITLAFFFSKTNPARGHWREYFAVFSQDKRREAVLIFLRLALPIMFMEFFWAVGQGVYKVIYARMGVPQLAAYTAIESIINLFSVAFVGFGNAAAVMIGKRIGENNYDTAFACSRRFIRLNFILMIPLGALLALLSPFMAPLFKLTGQAALYIRQGIQFYAILLSLKSYNFLMMTGILRAGGDSRFMVVIASLSISLIGIPLSLLGAFVWHWPFVMVLGMSFLEENIRNALCFMRYKSKRWLRKEEFL